MFGTYLVHYYDTKTYAVFTRSTSTFINLRTGTFLHDDTARQDYIDLILIFYKYSKIGSFCI